MLSQAKVEQFHRDGFLLGEKILSDAAVDRLRDELDRVIRQQDDTSVHQPVRILNLGCDDAHPIWQIVNIWEASEAFRELVTHPTIVEEVAQLSGAQELRIWHDQIQFKPSGTGGVNPWHQDSPYWPIIRPMDMVTAWVALDEVDESNGCMSMVPGSHAWGDAIDFIHGFLSKKPAYDEIPAEYQGHRTSIKRCPVRKGAVHFHHSLTWHGSHANTSQRPRRALGIHYMSERICFQAGGGHPMQPFVRVAPGQKLEGEHFPLVWQARAKETAGAER